VKGTPQGRKVLISALLGLGRANPDTCPFRCCGLSSTVNCGSLQRNVPTSPPDE